jgi:hypothetical protein
MTHNEFQSHLVLETDFLNQKFKENIKFICSTYNLKLITRLLSKSVKQIQTNRTTLFVLILKVRYMP